MPLSSRLKSRLFLAVASGFALAQGAAGCGGQSVSVEGDDDEAGGGGSGGSAGTGGAPRGGSAGTSAGGGGGTITGGSAGTSAGGGGGTITGGSAGTAAGGSGGTIAPSECPDRFDHYCFSLDELEAMVNSPGPWGGDQAPDGGYIVVTDCLPMEQVLDGCCNPASLGPLRDGELCCYSFCLHGCCGRPLVAGGALVLARPIERADWLAPSGGDEVEIDGATQAAAARAWLEDARAEHASVASFARFTLELMALGAPAALVAAAQQAGLDEIEHARLCFGLASRLANRELGPGPLDVAGIAPRRTLASAAAAAAREGCIGETVAAAVAEAELEAARDPDARRVLERIAADETNHAALAFEFVAWALATGGAEVRRAVAQAFLEARAGAGAQPEPEDERVDAGDFRALGRLTARERAELGRRIVEQVVAPCAERLLSSSLPS